MERCREFLAANKLQAPCRAGYAIACQFELLETAPEMGRPFTDMPELRELLIDFGDSGYIALYRYEQADQAVYMLAFRHRKEAGY